MNCSLMTKGCEPTHIAQAEQKKIANMFPVITRNDTTDSVIIFDSHLASEEFHDWCVVMVWWIESTGLSIEDQGEKPCLAGGNDILCVMTIHWHLGLLLLKALNAPRKLQA